MARPDRKRKQKEKQKALDHSQRMNHLKAKALAKVAEQSWALNERYKTITLLTEALRREPGNRSILIKLAAAYGRQRHYTKAEELLTRLLECGSNKASVYRQAAQTYALIDRPEKAMECYRQSLALAPDKLSTVPTLIEIAGLYERRHQLDQARAAIDEALQHDPANEDALLQQAVLLRRGGEGISAETKLRALIGDTRRSAGIRAQAWYELAQWLDDQQQFDDAFAAFSAAKRMLEQHAAPLVGQSQAELAKSAEMAAMLDRSWYERSRTSAESDSPYRFAVLTSHPRSGTTLVEQVLDSHDEVISSDEFDVVTHWIYLPIVRKFPYSMPILSILDRVPPAVRGQARATYWQQTEAIFDKPIGSRLLLDKNPAMTLLLPVVQWAFPEMKTLFALRDPRDVILSCFMQKLQPNPISVNWLSLSAAADYYAATMRMWLAVRACGDAAWLELRYEDLVVDLEAQAQRILDFLGLPWDDKVLRFYEHAREKIVRSPTYKDVTQPVYAKSVGRWQNYAKYLEPVIDKLRPFLVEFGYERG
jgi:tetratricopeptide (TPR) repeat protein